MRELLNRNLVTNAGPIGASSVDLAELMNRLPTAPSIPAGLTYAEFLDWHDEDIRAEWVAGEIIVMSPASRLHQRLAKFITTILTLYVEPRGLGEVIPAPFQMKPSPSLPGREPDVLFVAQQRVEIIRDNFVDGPADLVVEIISRESRTRDTIDKLSEYEEGGVKEYWLLDPEKREAKFFQLHDGKFASVSAKDDTYRSGVLPGLWIKVPWLWTIPTPSIPQVQAAWNEA